MLSFSEFRLNDTDLLYESIDVPGAAYPLMSVRGDILTMSLDRSFNGAYIRLGNNGSYSDIVWEYLVGEDEDDDASWARLPLQKPYNFDNTGVLLFRIPSNWRRNDNANYAIRARITSAGVDTATLLRAYPFPSFAYTTVKDVERLLLLRREGGLTEDTNPSISDVERIIMRIEGRIEGYSTQSWKPIFVGTELYDFARHGFVVRRYPIIDMLDLALWRGSSYSSLVEGRDGDYHVNPEKGMVTFSRIHTLPFTYSRHNLYGYGEFRNSIQLSYIWGKDIDFDDRAFMVRDIATKLVAADILSSYDYTAFIPEGTDRFGIERRIERWTTDAEERLEELRPLRMFV